MDDVKASDDEDFLAEVRKKFERAVEKEDDNRKRALDDIKFARLGEQWPPEVKKQREDDGRPCLVINHQPSFIRQVVNAARQNRPSINVIPADSKADPETAEIMSGLIRNIEVSSDADIAYDTAVESAVSGGFGYVRVNTDYTSDDTFDQDIVIERVADPFTVYGDPAAESADGSDWNCAFVCKTLTKAEFAQKYKGKDAVDWDGLGYTGLPAPWMDGENVMVAEYWHREDVEGQIVALSDGTVVDLKEYKERAAEYQAFQIMPVGEPRTVKRKKVTQYVVSGAELLDTVEWQGKYIPIVPVYGEEITIEGERHFKSLITDAKDAQREHNYWRSAGSEAIALAPKTPFIGEEGAFDVDTEKWSTANHASWPYITHKRGTATPQRQPYAGPPSGIMQQAVVAVDDMKAIIGLYNPSLGKDSNVTSGVGLRQQQRQGDIGTFHFIDNLSRSIRQIGRILIDLIPKVYSTARVVRVLGEDMSPQAVQIAPQDEQQGMEGPAMEGQEISKIYDITAGKYDLVVKAGPSYSTQREYANAEIVEIIRAVPESAPVLGPMYLRNSDWPGADEAAEKLEALSGGQGDPEQAQQMQQMQQALQGAAQRLQQLEQENKQLRDANFIKNKEADAKLKEANAKQTEADAKMWAAQNPPPVVQNATAGNPFAMEGSA